MKFLSRAKWRFIGHVAAVLFLPLVLVLLVNCNFVSPKHGWAEKWGPLVPHGTFPGDCSICHLPSSWANLKEEFEFDHAKETGYALDGAHEGAACLRCHNDRGPVELYVDRGCGGCHVDPHKSTLGLDCTECHNETHWQPVGLIAEHANTRMPLVGAHAITPCETCHQRATIGEFRGAPSECHSCHQRDAGGAFPNHGVNGWTRGCERCHTPLDWTAPGFNHNQFPLAGGHAGVDCTSCHAGGLFTPLDPSCFTCHQNDYINPPNHFANGISTN